MVRYHAIPPIILGGDPFNHQFRFLYRKDLWWKLHDEDYCLEVMRAAYDAGCRGYDLSFEENVNLFKRLSNDIDDSLVGFGNPTWEQGVMYDGRFIFFIRDRILRTLVDRIWPSNLSKLVAEKLSHEDVLVFGYDRIAPPLSDNDIKEIYLDDQIFLDRISIFKGVCQYLSFGGSDVDYLVSLGRMDLIEKMLSLVQSEGFIPLLLCQYPSLVLPEVQKARMDFDGFVIPLNKNWSWFDHESTVQAVHDTDKMVIAFMALSSEELRQDVKGALTWLYKEAGVDSILFGTAKPDHARETTQIAIEVRDSLFIN